MWKVQAYCYNFLRVCKIKLSFLFFFPQKFYSFLLTEYSRVIYMDSDGFAVSDLSHLFTADLPKEAELAAPQVEKNRLTVLIRAH